MPVVSAISTNAPTNTCLAALRMVLPMAVWAWLACWSLAVHAAPRVVDLRTEQADVALSPHLQTLEDPGSRFTLTTLLTAQQPWADYHRDTLNFGFSRSTWWVRVVLHNASSTDMARVISLGTPLQDEVDLYLLRGEGLPPQHFVAGDRQPFGARPVHTRVPSVPLRFAPGEQVQVYVRLATHDGLHEAVALKVWQPAAYATQLQTETLALGLYYGALGAVLLYNLFLFASTRQRGFGIYVAYMSAFLVWSFTFRGYAFQYWWPDAPVFNNQVLPIAAAACYFTFGIFSMSYLNTRSNVPRWMHLSLMAVTWGNVLAAMPALFNHYALSFAASIPCGLVMILSAMGAGLHMIRKGSRPARYFIIAFALLAVGVILYYLRLLGMVPSNIVTENFLQVGSALEAMLLAFGLADQMNTLKADKLHAEGEALAAQTALNDELESLVAQRTTALEKANKRLADMAITDELTGAYNRRQFNVALDAEVSRHARHQSSLAFCLLDVDNFKLYNDTHGHQAGDAVLQTLSSVVRGQLRRAGDQFFRLGGEEFGILLGVSEPDDQPQVFIEHIRREIEQMGMAHPGNPHGVVTASFGLVLLPQGAATVKAADIYARADKLLYEAKHAGRNRVVVQTISV
jgi:diguanylate cyclase (GGDEF)-like protein